MRRLGGLDATFLLAETPAMHMHVCGLMILDTSTMAPGDPYDHIVDLVSERLPEIPALRHRVATVPLNLGRPFWVDDPDFDIERHLHRLRLDQTDDRALAEVVADIAGTPLPRDRPLWEMWVIEGLPGDRVALVAKLHHSTIDGVSGAAMMGSLFDLSAERPTAAERRPDRVPRAMPSSVSLLGRTWRRSLSEPGEIVRLVPSTVGRVSGALVKLLRPTREGPGAPRPFTAPRVSFNATVTGRRTVAFAEVPLAEVKEVKEAFGVTINDVVTAVVGGGLRRYLEARGELPDRPLIAAEPVSAHGSAEDRDGTTKVSVMFSSLATDVADPAERLRTVASANRAAKEVSGTMGDDTLLQWMEHVWLGGFGVGARWYSRLRLADHHPVVHNLILSNVPGPPVPLYLAGARLVGLFPLGPIMDGAGLNVTVLSEEDRLGFGVVACAELVPDAWQVVENFPEALHELLAVAAHDRV